MQEMTGIHTKRSYMINRKYKSVETFLRVPVCDGRIIPGLEWAGVCRDIYQYLAVSWCVFSGEPGPGTWPGGGSLIVITMSLAIAHPHHPHQPHLTPTSAYIQRYNRDENMLG